jgi:biotin operon repressor
MQTILPFIPAGATKINDILTVIRNGEECSYHLGLYPIYKHKANDDKHFRLISAQLLESGTCQQCEIVKAFAVSRKKLNRAVKQLKERGVASFFSKRSGRKGGTVLTPDKLHQAQQLLNHGGSRCDVSSELSMRPDTLRKAINDGRLKELTVEISKRGSTMSERSRKDALAGLGMGTACTRPDERLAAAFGLSDGAMQRFENCIDVPFGGVLCAVPALLATGFLEKIDKLGTIKGYYTATQVMMVLAFISLCRIKTIEQLQGYSAGELGNLIGLDRIPEARCLRYKTAELAGGNNAEVFSAEMSSLWLKQYPQSAGFLYVDGHIKLYGGKTELPRRFVSRMRLCLRGISNYWVNDAIGQPFFMVEKQIDPGMLQVLREDIVPRLLVDVPDQHSQEELKSDPLLYRFVIVFDREGYSPAFFKEMWEEHRIACMTYRKNTTDKWSEEEFIQVDTQTPRGEPLSMKLAERDSILGTGKNAIKVKEIRKLRESGHQTSIVTTAYTLDSGVIAPMMFARWSQENFFAYGMHHFAIDGLRSYGEESFPETEKVVNPDWRELDRTRRSTTTKLVRARAGFMDMDTKVTADPNHKRHENWQIKKDAKLEDINILVQELSEVKSNIKKVQKHITWGELPEHQRFKKLPSSQRILMNTVGMIAYRAETIMTDLLRTKTITTTNARSILQDLFATTADLVPDQDKKELQVHLHGASTPATNQAIALLLKEINQTETVFPGTELTMVFESHIPA